MFDVILVVVTIIWAYFLWSRRKYYAFAWKMPGEWGWPLIGIAHKIYKPQEILYVLPRLAAKYKAKCFFWWFGLSPAIYIMDPKIAEIVLTSPHCINKAANYEVLNEALGEGLLTAKSADWHRRRKMINPCFNHKLLVSFFPTFNKLTLELCDKLRQHVNCGEVDVKELVFEMTMKASISTIMGLDDTEKLSAVFKEHVENATAIVAKRMFGPWFRNSLVYQMTSMCASMKHSHKIAQDQIHKLILCKFDSLKQNGLLEKLNTIQDSDDMIKKPSYGFLDQLIKFNLQKEYTTLDVISESNLMVIASYETTATALYETLMLLAMHPQYQERVYEEIITIFPEENFEVKREDFQNLVYLDMCINEALRTVPPIPIIAREASADIKISKDLIMPKGTQVFLDMFNMHRDEEVWGPSARTYNPDHFLPANLIDKHKFSFMPFSNGPRNCIGWQFSGMFLRVALAQILRKYRFSTSFQFKDLVFVEFIIMKHETVPKLEVHRR